MFVDDIVVHVKAGSGGAGCVAFHREAFRPKGGPSGGNGGRGGSVVLEATDDLTSLVQQFYQPWLVAKNGLPGKGRKMEGRSGKDLVVKVPCGTRVWRIEKRPLGAASDPGSGSDSGDSAASETFHDTDSPEPEEIGLADGHDSEESVEDGHTGIEGEGEAAEEGIPRAEEDQDEDGDPSEFEEDSDTFKLVSQLGGEGAVLRQKAGGEIRAIEIDLEELPEESEAQPQFEKIEVFEVDMLKPGQRHILCKGGRGGLGNKNFSTARRQAPKFAQPGEPGEEADFRLELLLIADVGLVGFPNAGKSTLLSVLSAATPKIADYPFTTLNPSVGVIEYKDFQRVTMCDIPGLIEGAHRNVGLGHEFLRHIQRCRVLAIVLDMAGTDGRQPWEDYEQLLQELALYDASLMEKARVVIANKMDEAPSRGNLEEFHHQTGIYPDAEIAAAFDLGLDKLKELLLLKVRACE